ncbi:DUF2231 domain-containing protein [Sulfurovum sp.]|jgi:uncharacterized membrane protein|uniref:DUF2231 domain-containing protein n=1 Tax=Sulfurovum sp. TaxID=1969726 RepID=UPI002A37262D|nr:DUF2231 domain-containing protein [Sulfurovum sp.]MDY0402461.1 hypothetical protein [Sulfurovum sp.]
MNLPTISIPQIDLPFEIPLLLHPPVDHFAIALPIVVLIIEFINLFAKRRALSVLSLFFMITMMIAVTAAYFTGSVDGKEAYPLLNEAGQAELKGHKLLGTYLMLASGVVLLFKLAAMMASRGLVKAFYLLVLVIFVAGILKQGKDGGEIVYEFGANVEMVKTLDDEKFDLEEERDELQGDLKSKTEALKAAQEELASLKTNAAEAKKEADTIPKSVMPSSDTNISSGN